LADFSVNRTAPDTASQQSQQRPPNSLLEKKRKVKHLTQHQLAEILSSSQSRVAKMEKGDTSVSLDLLIRSLLALGTSRNELASAIVSGNY
jgi:transcriptional regulator with XRE-family HTH domain